MKLTNDQKSILAVGVVVIVAAYLLQRQVKEAAATVGNAINPVNPENVFYSGANAVTRILTGSENSFGTWLYEKFNKEPVFSTPDKDKLTGAATNTEFTINGGGGR